MDIDIFNIINKEYECAICNNIPYIPIKLKIIKSVETMEFSIGSCLKYWNVCDDVFCKSCILKMLLYAFNDDNKLMSGLKCPVCNQRILISEDMSSYLDCIIEDKKIKKITDFIYLSNNDEIFDCRFNCGKQFTKFNDVIDHMYNAKESYELNCPKRIIECSGKHCKELMNFEKNNEHNNICISLNIRCPFCQDLMSFKSKNEFLNHMKDFHMVSAPNFSISISNLF
jgi:hypothetical protein